MLGETFGHFFDRPLSKLAVRIKYSPNTLTVIGFIVTMFASYLLLNNFFWGGILVLFGGFFDILDGVVARVNNKTSKFGAFLDSVLDRYSDALIFIAVALNLAKKSNLTGACLSLGILVGAFLISYTRARAEGLGIRCSVGIMARPERLILMVFGTLTGLVMPVLWFLLVLTHITVAQRIYHVMRISDQIKSS
jgi:phosphatidylglycerophosphate synthase